MAAAAARVLGSSLRSGLIVAPTDGEVPDRFELVVGEHPHPGDGSLAAGRRALHVAAALSSDDQLLVLLSGGASALLAAPAAGLTLEDKRRTAARLLTAGASIHDLNTVRKQLSAIKGGRLAMATAATTRTLVLSDVVGDDLGVIGSGPTVPDRATPADALAVLDRFGGRQDFPPAVIAYLSRPADLEQPAAERRLRQRGDVVTVIGGRHGAMRGAAAAAAGLGYQTAIIDEAVVGEARAAAPALIEDALGRTRERSRPCCVVASGETTVTVRGPGKGGRNQELALAAVPLVATGAHEAAATLLLASVGTDGIDGPTDAAGAMADPTTLARARAAGLAPPAAFLAANDAYHFFAPLGDLVITGPTGTNVGDLQVVLVP